MTDFNKATKLVLCAASLLLTAMPASALSWTHATPTAYNQTQGTPSSVRPPSLKHDEHLVKVPCAEGSTLADGSRLVDCYAVVKKTPVVRPVAKTYTQAYRVVRPVISVPVPAAVRVVRPVIGVPVPVAVRAPLPYGYGPGYGAGYGARYGSGYGAAGYGAMWRPCLRNCR